MSGERLYFTGPKQLVSGYMVNYGEVGVVAGPSSEPCPTTARTGLKMKFANAEETLNCIVEVLSREPPLPLPDGHCTGEQLYFTGLNISYPDGDRLVFGARGTVVGPSKDEPGLAVYFPGNKEPINIGLEFLTLDDPTDDAVEPSAARLRARRALAARKGAQDRMAGASRAEGEAEAERRQRLADELLEAEAEAKSKAAGTPRAQEYQRRRPPRATLEHMYCGRLLQRGIER